MPDLLKTVHWTVTSGALLAEDGWPSGPVRAESGFTAVLDRESRPGNCGTTGGRTGASRWLHMSAHGIIDHLDRDLEDLPEPRGGRCEPHRVAGGRPSRPQGMSDRVYGARHPSTAEPHRRRNPHRPRSSVIGGNRSTGHDDPEWTTLARGTTS